MRIIESPHAYPPDLIAASSTWHLVFENPPSDADVKIYIDAAATDDFYTCASLRTATKQIAHALRNEIGLRPGETICFFAANSIHYPVLIHGAQAAALICTFANPASTLRELQRQSRVNDR